MNTILLSNGQQTQVSDEDFIWASGFSWSVDGRSYVCTRIKNKLIKLHRLIAKRTGIDCQNQIDHIDRDKLNNQRENLRAATSSENHINSGLPKHNISGYRGVRWHKNNQKWVADIQVKGKGIFLGYYDRKEQAIYARKIAEQKYFGKFTNTGE